MQIPVRCNCGEGSCEEWGIIELQGVVEPQPGFHDSLPNLQIGTLCRPSSQASVEGKETEEKLVVTTKTTDEHDRDRISELPDSVLLHMMQFLETKDVVQTCVLSTRWKDLWKSLTSLAFLTSQFNKCSNCNNFVLGVLSSRDDSIPLLRLVFVYYDLFRSLFNHDDYDYCCINPVELLNRVMEYAVLHNCKHLTIDIDFSFRDEFRPFIFSCPSLTFLQLSVSVFCPIWKLPNSLQLPALQTLILENVCFSPSDNDRAEPFSTCNLLDTLVLTDCHVDQDVKVLCISNSSLSSLTLTNNFGVKPYNIVLSTSNLRFLVARSPGNHQLYLTSNFLHLEQVYIDAYSSINSPVNSPVIISWLPLLTNIKKLILSMDTVKFISRVLSNPDSVETQPPCFVRLESLKLTMDSFYNVFEDLFEELCDEEVKRGVSDEEVNRVVQFLLQNSPLNTIDVIKC